MVGRSDLIGGRYRLEEQISSDGWATLYKATDERDGREVLVDVLHAQHHGDRLASDLRKRARAVAALTHPGLTRVLDVGDTDGNLYVVTEVVEGRSLAELAREGDTPIAQAIARAMELLDALDHAHDAGLAHGDLRAGRVIVPAGGRAKITGFTDPRVAATKAPEVTGDLAQVGALLYYLLGGDVAEESLPQDLRDFIDRWADPASLPPLASAASMRDELSRLGETLATDGSQAVTANAERQEPPTVWPISGRHYDPDRLGRRVIAVAIALALIALAAFLWRVASRVDDRPVPPLPSISPPSPAAVSAVVNQSGPTSVFLGGHARPVTLEAAPEAPRPALSRGFPGLGDRISAGSHQPRPSKHQTDLVDRGETQT